MDARRNGVLATPEQFLRELTPREQQIAELIAEGLTNDQIAVRLTLTPGTVANHVAHILAKTGVRSRLHVAVTLARATSSRSAPDVLALLTRLQALGPTDVHAALQHATEVLAAFFAADVCDAFLYEPADEVLSALASSHTPLGERQRALNLHHLPVSHGGRVGWVFQQQQPFRDGHVDDDAFELVAVRRDLGIRSTLGVPFAVGPEQRGVIVVRSVAAEYFAAPDLDLLQFVAYWLALVVQQQHTPGRNGHVLVP